MQSNQQHIDDFFREKEASFLPGDQHLETHWQQFKAQLTVPGGQSPATGKLPVHIIRIIKYLGGMVVIIVVTLLVVKTARHTSSKKIATTHAKTPTLPARAVANQHPAVQKVVAPAATTIVPATSTTTKKATKAVTVVPAKHHKLPITKHYRVKLKTKKSIIPTPASLVSTTTSVTTAGNNRHPNARQLLQAFYDQLQKQPQQFTIAANRDTTITAAEGTQLTIAANTFVNKTGVVKGKVRIILQEYYRYDDIVAARLSTTSDNEQLVTGGMIHIIAQQDGEDVQIAPQKSITVNMPTSDYDKEMMLFTAKDPSQYTAQPGDSSAINTFNPGLNWQRTVARLPQFDPSGKSIKILNLNLVEPYDVSYGNKTTARFYVSRDITIPVKELKVRLQQRFGTYYDVIKIKKAPKKQVTVPYNNYSALIDSTTLSFGKALKLKLLSPADSAAYVQQQQHDSLAFDKQLKTGWYYGFTIEGLGWVNCDRFLKDPGPKVQFTVNLGKDYDAANFVSQLVFTRYRSVTDGYYAGSKIRFRNIPDHEPVQLVSIGVKNDQVVACIQSLTVSKNEVNNLVFEPVTPEQFKKQLKITFAFKTK